MDMIRKRYNAFADELRRMFGCRVQRVSVDAGFTCPNRDGTVGTGGCSFCDTRGAGAPGTDRHLPVARQLEEGMRAMAARYGARKFLAYFQPFSNTHAPIAILRALYDEALAVPGVAGLMVGTRPDCLPPPVLALLAGYACRTYFWLELGVQSLHERTLARINRGHGAAASTAAIQACRQMGIRVCAHVILGLPGEGRREMLATADALAALGIDGVKIHLLHLLRGTPLADLHDRGELALLGQDEYVGLVCDFIERLHPQTVIHRLTGEGPRDLFLAPAWALAKGRVLQAIDNELEQRGTRQGERFAGTVRVVQPADSGML